MAIGSAAAIIHRFNSVKYNTQDFNKKHERLNLLISDLEDAFEIPVQSDEAMKQFQEKNEFLYNIYIEIIDFREVVQDALVGY